MVIAILFTPKYPPECFRHLLFINFFLVFSNYYVHGFLSQTILLFNNCSMEQKRCHYQVQLPINLFCHPEHLRFAFQEKIHFVSITENAKF